MQGVVTFVLPILEVSESLLAALKSSPQVLLHAQQARVNQRYYPLKYSKVASLMGELLC